MERRDFIKTFSLLSAIPVITGYRKTHGLFFLDEDEKICLAKFALAAKDHLADKPINEEVIAMGKSFIGTPYEANTLEQPGPEHLVINLRGLDCVTFCENSLDLARCIKQHKTTFSDFKAGMQNMRYRGGIINGYPSRLNYFSDYIFDGEKKKVFKNVTEEIGGVPYKKHIDFMSTHPDDYPKLKGNPDFIKRIREQEDAMNQRAMFHIPKDEIDKVGDKIHSGDILAITTAIPGIDVSHTGIAIWQDGKLHFMHAPNVGYKVQITQNTLSQHMASYEKQLGIMVARPLEV